METIKAQPLKGSQIAASLRNALSPNVFGQWETDDIRISLAGAQEKMALLKYKGKWYRHLKETPSSHIFKLPMSRQVGKE